MKKDFKSVVLNDGEVVTRTGHFFDKTGAAIEDGWDATKRGIKKAGDAIGDAARCKRCSRWWQKTLIRKMNQ
ncbi:MAG: hypothetical protein ABI204_01620 [Ginsengibacter sp.]